MRKPHVIMAINYGDVGEHDARMEWQNQSFDHTIESHQRSEPTTQHQIRNKFVSEPLQSLARDVSQIREQYSAWSPGDKIEPESDV